MTRFIFLLLTFSLAATALNAQWVQVTTPPDSGANRLLSDGVNLYATRPTGGIYLSTNNGTSWTDIGSSLVKPHLRSASSNAIYATSRISTTNNDTFLLQVSTNNGTTWNSHGAGLPPDGVPVSFVFTSDSAFAIAESRKVYLTTNNGTTWTDFSSGLPSIIYVGNLLIQNGYLYASIADDIPDALLGGIYRRPLNGSANWTRCTRDGYPPIPFNPFLVKGIGTNYLIGSGNTIYCFYSFYDVVTRQLRLDLEEPDLHLKSELEMTTPPEQYNLPYWYRSQFSTSNGSTFSIANFVPAEVYPEIMIGDAIFGNGSSNGTFLGLLRYTGGSLEANNWTPVNEGLPTSDYSLSRFVICNNYLFASNFSSGKVWRRPLSQLSAQPTSQTQPQQFELKQNYPNPFNPNTTIAYDLKSTSTVSLKVYDLLGKELSTLVNERKPAGSYQTTFNATNLSSGTYFYRLQAGDFTQTKRMTLVK